MENLDTGDEPLFVWGAKFSHVTLTGNFGRLVINSSVNPPAIPIGDSEEFKMANTPQATTDWTLDISNAHAQELTLRGIQAQYVRIDPQTQAIVRREMVPRNSRWKSACSGTWWFNSIEAMMKSDQDDVLLITPRSRPDADVFIRAIEELRNLGIADMPE
ncbi:hypothetical protein [Streptomyces sp. NPDC048332]|uniref:hypothetical protein n=1 Tax=Streptomyces sp. NPDC048332 TaxID=3154619 RepID=UPI0034492E06